MQVILTYHSIDDSESVISTTPEKFRTQMQSLTRSGIRVISLRELVDRIKENRLLSQPAVAITFDDGFRSFRENAFPALKEFGFPATVFLVTGFCGKNNRWMGQPRHIPTFDLLDWDEILEMSAQGIEMGAHTITHPDLSQLTVDQAEEEITRSREMIRQRLGKEVLFFAFPYGIQTMQTKKLVEVEFYGACSAELGFVVSQSDAYFLPRIDMYYFSRNDFFSWIGTPRFKRYVQYRSVLRSFRRSYRRMM